MFECIANVRNTLCVLRCRTRQLNHRRLTELRGSLQAETWCAVIAITTDEAGELVASDLHQMSSLERVTSSSIKLVQTS